jgi:NAD(P) transhydrogenase subunit alpha
MPKVFVRKEWRPGETRVAATPETVKKLVREGLEVAVEPGAGAGSYFADAAYVEAGAALADDAEAAWRAADVALVVAPPSAEEAAALKGGALLLGFLAPHREHETVRRLAAGGVTALAVELLPRITRAQPMDALSSQASIAGYKAALLAAVHLPRYFPLLMTAAGTIPPARVVVMGAGVAGLQAIATAKRLGAVVEVSDVRAAVKEQVESLGGRFIELPTPAGAESGEGAGGYAREMGEEFLARQRQLVGERVAAADAVVTTALVPGRPAPRLVTRAMVESMRPGSVVVDLAVGEGGNCELSQADREVVHDGVVVLAPSNLAATIPHHASTLYARNLQALLLHLWKKDRGFEIDTADEIVAGALLTHGGEVKHAPTAELVMAPAAGSGPA